MTMSTFNVGLQIDHARALNNSYISDFYKQRTGINEHVEMEVQETDLRSQIEQENASLDNSKQSPQLNIRQQYAYNNKPIDNLDFQYERNNLE